MSKTRPLADEPAFFRFLIQALTIGRTKLTTSTFPTVVGIFTYAAVVVLLIALLIATGSSTQTLLAVGLLLAFLATFSLLMSFGKTLHKGVFNVLFSIVVLGFLGGVIIYPIVAITRQITRAPSGPSSVWIRGNVFDGSGRPVSGARVSLPGEGAHVTGDNGEFSFQIQHQQLLAGDSVELIVRSGEITESYTVLALRPIRIRLRAISVALREDSSKVPQRIPVGRPAHPSPRPGGSTVIPHAATPETPRVDSAGMREPDAESIDTVVVALPEGSSRLQVFVDRVEVGTWRREQQILRIFVRRPAYPYPILIQYRDRAGEEGECDHLTVSARNDLNLPFPCKA
jgi:hypothetical protein